MSPESRNQGIELLQGVCPPLPSLDCPISPPVAKNEICPSPLQVSRSATAGSDCYQLPHKFLNLLLINSSQLICHYSIYRSKIPRYAIQISISAPLFLNYLFTPAPVRRQENYRRQGTSKPTPLLECTTAAHSPRDCRRSVQW